MPSGSGVCSAIPMWNTSHGGSPSRDSSMNTIANPNRMSPTKSAIRRTGRLPRRSGASFIGSSSGVATSSQTTSPSSRRSVGRRPIRSATVCDAMLSGWIDATTAGRRALAEPREQRTRGLGREALSLHRSPDRPRDRGVADRRPSPGRIRSPGGRRGDGGSSSARARRHRETAVPPRRRTALEGHRGRPAAVRR